MFQQHSALFHGPGGLSTSWLSLNNQRNGEYARSLGVPSATIYQVQQFQTIRTLQWQAISAKATMQILGPRVFAIASTALTARWAYQFVLSVRMTNLTAGLASGGVKAAAATQAAQRITAAGGYTAATQAAQRITAAGGYTAATQATRRTARRQITKRLAVRGAASLGLKAIPIVGWGFLAYDIYTVAAHGELWGVKLYEEEVVPVP